MADIINLDMATTLDLPPDRILTAALGKLGEVMVIGRDHDGNEYIASSTGDVGKILYLLELAKIKAMASVE
jgi:hypothetical protein